MPTVPSVRGLVGSAPGSVTGHYSLTELEQLWVNAGGPARLAPTAAAIAMAESSGDPHAHNSSGASGLWQILGAPSGVSGNVFDPATNAKMAVAKYRQAGNSWSPWVTYTSGAYRQWLGQARTAASKDPFQKAGDAVSSAVSSVTGAVGSAADFFGMVTSGAFWIRVLEVIAGAALLAIGLWTLTGHDLSDVVKMGEAGAAL